MQAELDPGFGPAEGADASVEPEVSQEQTEVEPVELQETDGGETESPPVEDQTSSEEKDSFQERIDRLTRFRREAEREADALRQEREDSQKELADLKARLDSYEAQAKPTKTLADFDYNEAEYAAYVQKEAMEQARSAAKDEATRIANETQARLDFERKQRTYNRNATEFAKDQADFFEVTQDRNLPITQEMADVIYDSDIGPQIAYYLAKHPDEAYSIARSSPAGQGRQIGAIESRLQAELSKSSKTATDAPPAQKERVKGKQPGFQTDPKAATSDKMSDAEWLKRREAQLAKKNG